MRDSPFDKAVISRPLLLGLLALASLAVNAEPKHYQIAAQPLAEALLEFSLQSGLDVVATEGLAGFQSALLQGDYEIEPALKILLGHAPVSINISNNAVLLRPRDVDTHLLNPGLDTIDEVVVSGIRGSLRQSLRTKKNADTISDVITQEEVGKFPDGNVAESLQRIPGVSISRTRSGEGQFASVRGFGQQFNLVTLNNRILATDNVGREFSFDVLPSETIADVQVVKTPMANMDEGSIGGAIKMTTFNPLANKGEHESLTVAGLYDELAGEWGKKYSGFASNTYLDERLGLGVGVSYSDRLWRADMVQSLGSSFSDIDVNNNGQLSSNEKHLFMPAFLAYPLKTGERQRTGLIATAVMEFSPDLVSRLDLLYTHYQTPEKATYQTNDLSQTYRPGSVKVDNNGTVTHFAIDQYVAEVAIDPKNRNVDTWQAGWNLQWQMLDMLAFETDISYSAARRPQAGKDKFWVVGIEGATAEYTAADPIPFFNVKLRDGRSLEEASLNELRTGYMQTQGDTINDDVFMARLTATLQIDSERLKTIEAGFSLLDRDKEKISMAGEGRLYLDMPFHFSDVGIDATKNFPVDDFLEDFSGALPRRWPDLDAELLYRLVKASDGKTIGGNTYPADYSARLEPGFFPAGSNQISESNLSPFLQFNFSGSYWKANLGGRLAFTRINSSGWSQTLLALKPIPGKSDEEAEWSPAVPVSYTNRYVNFLPSANVTLDSGADWLLRAGLSKTMSRPSIAQLGFDEYVETNSSVRRYSHNGNPRLKPVIAVQGDLAFEWYYADSSFISVSSYYKNIHGFVTSTDDNEIILGKPFLVTRPENNKTLDVVGAELGMQHLYESGFGLQVNVTLASYAGGRHRTDSSHALILENFSRVSWNLVGLYEKNRFEHRLAINYRSNYIQNVAGQAGQPETVNNYMQVDFRSSYKLSDNTHIFIEGVNMLDAYMFVYSRYKNRLIEFEQFSPRYSLGIRCSF